MTRLKTILQRQLRPIRDTDRFSLTPAGEAALDQCNRESHKQKEDEKEDKQQDAPRQQEDLHA